MQNPRVTFQMNTGRTIVLELLPDQAPNTVRSFLWLARNSCYTGHSIQRIVPGYVVDASYNAFGKEMACYLIDNESTSHGFPNHLRLEPGTIAMGGYGVSWALPAANSSSRWPGMKSSRTTTPASGG